MRPTTIALLALLVIPLPACASSSATRTREPNSRDPRSRWSRGRTDASSNDSATRRTPRPTSRPAVPERADPRSTASGGSDPYARRAAPGPEADPYYDDPGYDDPYYEDDPGYDYEPEPEPEPAPPPRRTGRQEPRYEERAEPRYEQPRATSVAGEATTGRWKYGETLPIEFRPGLYRGNWSFKYSNDDTQSGLGFGVRAGWFWKPNVEALAGLSYGSTETKAGSGGGGSDTSTEWEFGGGARYYLGKQGQLRPFAELFIGRFSYNRDNSTLAVSYGDFFWSLGLGAEVFFSPRFAVTIGLSQTSKPGAVIDTTGGGKYPVDDRSTLALETGFSFFF